jgi:hypothetical protein
MFESIFRLVVDLYNTPLSRFRQRHGLQSETLNSYFYKNIYIEK